jgi:hypothetical protein
MQQLPSGYYETATGTSYIENSITQLLKAILIMDTEDFILSNV